MSTMKIKKGDTVRVITGKEVKALVDVTTGRRFPVQKKQRHENFRMLTEYEAEVLLVPGVFGKYRWE